MVVQWLVLFFLEGVANFCHGVAKNPDALCGGASGVGFTLVLVVFFLHFQAGVISLAKKKVDVA